MMTTHTNLWMVLSVTGVCLLVAPGCNRNQEAWSPGCVEQRVSLNQDDLSSLGFSGADILAFSEGTYNETLAWEDGSTTDLTLEVAYADGVIYYVDSEVEETPDDVDFVAEIAPICEDYVTVEVEVRMVTADGALDEAWALELSSFDGERGSFNRELVPGAMGGSYDYMHYDPDDYDVVSASVSVAVTAEGSEGSINEQAELTDGDVASAAVIAVGTWDSISSEGTN